MSVLNVSPHESGLVIVAVGGNDRWVHRLLILLSLPPLLLMVVLRRLMADRVLSSARKRHSPAENGEKFARSILIASGLDDVGVEVKKLPWMGSMSAKMNRICLPPARAASSSQADCAWCALQVGIALLARTDANAIGRIAWATRFGHVFPIFTTVVVVFAMLAAKLPPLTGLGVIASSLALACLAQVLCVVLKLRAAELVNTVIEKKNILPRIEENDAMQSSIRAWAWHAIAPGLLSRIMD